MENNIKKEDLLALVKSKIYTIRGQKVMLDFDLAQMYNVKTGSLNQSVKRNIERFPDDFMFQLTETEWEEWKSQYVTSNFLENKEVSDLLSQNVTAKSMNKKRRASSTAQTKASLQTLPETHEIKKVAIYLQVTNKVLIFAALMVIY